MKGRRINPQEKIEQVVRATRRLIVDNGYHNVAMPQIVAASGVSVGAIYHHFGNKEGVARIVHGRTLSQFQEQFRVQLEGADSCREKLTAFVRLVFEVAEDDPVAMEYMLLVKHREFLADEPPICSSEPFRLVQEIIAAGIVSGELRSQDPFLAAVAFTGVILRAVELKLAGVLQQPLDEIEEALLTSAWAAIAA